MSYLDIVSYQLKYSSFLDSYTKGGVGVCQLYVIISSNCRLNYCVEDIWELESHITIGSRTCLMGFICKNGRPENLHQFSNPLS